MPELSCSSPSLGHPMVQRPAGTDSRTTLFSCCLDQGHSPWGYSSIPAHVPVLVTAPPAWLPPALPLQSEALQQLHLVFLPSYASQLHHPFVWLPERRVSPFVVV